MTHRNSSEPQAQLSVFDAVIMMVGLVVGIGIFRTPSIVAGSVDSGWMFVGVWVLGGLVTLVGALCYAELSAANPNAGGEYHFLSRAYGKSVAMLFGWARCTVIQTGAIAAVAFVLGDYLSQILSLGAYSSAIYGAVAVVIFTAVNVVGTKQGKNVQVVVTFIQMAAIVAIILFGIFGTGSPIGTTAGAIASQGPTVQPETAALGLAMIFVLLTYGGWNEAAYLTGELRDAPRNIVKVLAIGTFILVLVYTLTNFALWNILGLEGLRNSDAVAADMMRQVAGAPGELIVTLAIVVAAISTLNATIFTGGRAFYALGRDLTIMRWLSKWNARGQTPANGQIAQAIMALALIGMGAIAPDGFKAMVDYTAPVFWGFLLLVGVALFILRKRHPERNLPFRVPFYPLTPILFCLGCLYMLRASIVYTGNSAWVGIVVLAAGLPLLWFKNTNGSDPFSIDQGANTDPVTLK